MSIKLFFKCLFSLFIMAFLTACGPGNTVRLLPAPALEASSLPAPTAPSICVVNFKNDRKNPGIIGERRDGSSFSANEDVETWISRYLADELARKGYRVTFALTAIEGRNSAPDYLVTGIVNEVWLKENSATEMSAQMRISCTLANRKGKLWTELCNSNQTKTGFPFSEAADVLLQDTLEELVKPVIQKIQNSIK